MNTLSMSRGGYGQRGLRPEETEALEGVDQCVEIAEFVIGSQSFGVNVAKIREFVSYDQLDVTPVPESHNAMQGVFVLRDMSIPLINLEVYLNVTRTVERSSQQVVAIADFNRTLHGFVIDSVTRIHRLSWRDMQPLTGRFEHYDSVIIGSIHIDNRQILILDIERIIDDIFPASSMAAMAIGDNGDAATREERGGKKLIIADDSISVRGFIVKALASVGYTNVTAYENGRDAYNRFVELRMTIDAEGRSISDFVNLAVFDIEMPLMDGLTLCRNVKDDLGLLHLPVIIFSSLINEQIAARCEAAGADGYVAKPQIDDLIGIIDKTILTPIPAAGPKNPQKNP